MHKKLHTYMSVLVTGVPTRKRANRKLNTSDVEPSGATYSAMKHEMKYGNGKINPASPARIYSRASVLPINCESLRCHVMICRMFKHERNLHIKQHSKKPERP